MSANDLDPEQTLVAKSHLGFPVVGIGASAGGIPPLRRLIETMPADCGIAFVIVMHLSPDHESSLGEILGRAGRLPVITVVESMPIEPNHIYVISPALKLVMSHGHLRVSPLKTMEGRRQSIDIFFRSLAQAHRERSVGVVLSGTGSDGSQGLKRIKELGGVAMAQSPEDAEFDAMPLAAASTGMVDFVLPAGEMAAKLLLLWENAKRIEMPSPPRDLEVETSTGDDDALAEEALLSIKALLRERTGHDFAHYKRGTVLRRLERRMQVKALPDLPSYRRLLDTDPAETFALLQDMLISVTNFFRDPDAFSTLQSTLEASIAERPAGEPFRAWVAGCATGEEAYSVAIALRELLGPAAPLTVFASDIDQRAVASARTGLFPASIATDVSPERLRECFAQEPAGHRVVKSLRDIIVFSAHNVLGDPPFTRMDLICCRNLLIYLDRSAQAQLMRSFHFALKPRGLLFLGSSETADAGDGLFEAVDKGDRIYRAALAPSRARPLPPMTVRLPLCAPAAPPPGATQAVAAQMPPLEALHQRVLSNCGPPTVLVDADDTVLHVSEHASHLLRLPAGAPSNKLMALARPELRAELRAALALAADSGRIVEAPRVALMVNGQERIIAMSVRPATGETPAGLMLVIFDELQESLAGTDPRTPDRHPFVESLEAELLKTQDRLRSTVGESAASTEELRASNEELQTINEELRSTTEELETSREELQAVNEELTTVNSELTIRIDETSKVNDDLQNLMASAEIGMVFVDRELRVKRFTPQAAALFKLLPTDAGRPLLDLVHRLEYPELRADVDQVLRELQRVERKVRSDDGRWFLARVAPYRAGEDRIEGAVLALFDITSLREAQEELGRSERRMALIADSMRDYAIVTMDEGGTIVTWSAGAERIFGYAPAEAVGQPFALIFTEEDRAAGKAAEELARAFAQGRATDDRWHRRKDGGRVFCGGITTPLNGDGVTGFAKIARDFTNEQLDDQKRELSLAQERATSGTMREANAMKDQFLAIVSHELKNPLSIIHMNAQLIGRLPASAADPRLGRSSQTILSAVASQAQIIDDLLDLSRVNMGKISIAPVPLDMDMLVGGIVEAVGAEVGAKKLVLTVELDPAPVFGDRVRVEQIVWNLLSNAIKFTPEGGSVALALSSEEGMARLSVADSGIGLDASSLVDVFEMFKQVESVASRARTGLGIGLALVKELAELHGGRVAAESDGLGLGSRFSVWLPSVMGAGGVAPVAAARSDITGMRLLVVDDEPDMLMAFAILLESEGAEATTAGSAKEALTLAVEGNFDAVLSDIAMPAFDGLWLARQLRQEPRTAKSPLIAVSGMAREADRGWALNAGFDEFVGKPLDFDALRLAILGAVASRKVP